MNLPNKLTLARCAMAAIFVVLMSIEHIAAYVIAYIVFTVAAITDYYDGKIARAQNLVTNFGKLIDPVADKVLMVAAFIMLMTIGELRIPGWAIILILAREYMVTGARSLAASKGNIIAANIWGKRKTVFQMVYVFTFLFMAILLRAAEQFETFARFLPGGKAAFTEVIGWASLGSIICVSLYTVYSGVRFTRINWEILGLHNQT